MENRENVNREYISKAFKTTDSDEFRMQLHSKRYDEVLNLYKLISTSVITLNGGAIFAVLTSGLLKEYKEHINLSFAIFL